MKRIIFLFLLLQIAFFTIKAEKYNSDSIYFVNDTIRFGGTLTYPAREGKYPAVIIISGTGEQNRDGRFGEHRPFFRIADYLTQKGFAVLRIDDRGTGQTNGRYEDATTLDFAHDITAAIKYLKTRKEIDKKRIGLIGHSEGGCVAFMLAADCPDVSFMVSLAGVGVNGVEILKLQNDAILRSDKRIDQRLVDNYMSLYSSLFDAVKATPLNEKPDSALYKTFRIWKNNQSQETLKAMNMVNGRDQMFISRYAYHAAKAWYRVMINYDPAKFIPRIKIPLLAMNGDKDIMVPARQNLENIEYLLKKGKNKHYQISIMPGHNHMFQHCVECTQQEIPTLPEDISQQTLDTMYNWLSKEILQKSERKHQAY